MENINLDSENKDLIANDLEISHERGSDYDIYGPLSVSSIESAKDIEDIGELISKSDGLQGEEDFYTKDELQDRFEAVKAGAPIGLLPRANGLRGKVEMIVNKTRKELGTTRKMEI